ncbi:MAG: MBL fold metallo-hydrolase [Gammaproteobacteria bacterium]|nr:MBL fold metallo-hydrolase [Gammaproteobacteria bacterium]
MTLFRQLFDPTSASLSYVMADPVTRAAAVIDPAPNLRDSVGELLAQLGLHLRYVLETHALADGDTSLPELRAETGARLAAHASAPLEGCDQRLQHGDRIYLGEEMLEVIHTPGATPCSVTFRWGDRLFTGDTLWIGRAGDFSGAHSDAGALYDSVHTRLFCLPDEYLVYPGHDRHGHRVSSIGQEKLTNNDLRQPRDSILTMSRHPATLAQA